MTPQLKVYLACPYSDPDPAVMERRYRASVIAAGVLMKLGYVVFSPVAHTHEIGKEIATETDHDFWMNQDLPMLRLCDEVFVLAVEGWNSSRGVAEEVMVARNLGIGVTYFHPENLGMRYTGTEWLGPEKEALVGAAIHGEPDPPHLMRGVKKAASKETNPKDAIGSSKVPMHLLPGPALAWAAMAHLDGALKYGPYNWRTAGVRSSIYMDAVMRHLEDWFNGEDDAEDSGLPHLAHAIAGLNILIDAGECGMLYDDRPEKANVSTLFNMLNRKVAAMKARSAS